MVMFCTVLSSSLQFLLEFASNLVLLQVLGRPAIVDGAHEYALSYLDSGLVLLFFHKYCVRHGVHASVALLNLKGYVAVKEELP